MQMAGCIRLYPTKTACVVILNNRQPVAQPDSLLHNRTAGCITGQSVAQRDSRLRNGTAGCVTGQLLSNALKRDSRLHNRTAGYTTGIRLRNRQCWASVRNIYM